MPTNTPIYTNALYPCGASEGNLTLSNVAPSTVNGADQQNSGFKGVLIVTNITAIGGSLTITLQGKDHISGAYFDVASTTGYSGTGSNQYLVYPGAGDGSGATSGFVLPPLFRIKAVIGVANATATVSLTLIP